MTQKADLQKRQSKLSPAKRALLGKRLKSALTTNSELPVIAPRPAQGPVPLSFAQERLWFFDQLQPGNPAYNRPLAFRLRGALNVPALEQALSTIVQRHEVLRATFVGVEGRPVQTIWPALPVPLPLVDLGKHPPVEREFRARQLTAQEAENPFDLSQGPLLRAILFRLNNDEHVLLVVIHHIAFDAWSAKIFKKELVELYDALVAEKSASVPDLPIQYADFAYWQREQLQGERLDKHLLYWKRKLNHAPSALHLPTDYPRPATQSHQGARHQIVLSASLLKSLKTLSRQAEATLFMTLLAAFKVLLHRYSNQDDIVVGSPIAGRLHAETEGLIGLFVNTLALRTNLSGNPSFKELLRRVREMALGAYAHQDLPFEKLVEVLQPERILSHTPLFQVMFNLENIPSQAVPAQSLRIEDFELESKTSLFDLTLEIVERDDSLDCVFEYNTTLFNAATITRMAGHFQILLEGIAANPEQHIDSLPLLTEAERHQLLVEWNDTQADYPHDKCIHKLFEVQVEQTPDAVAVVFENQQLTYRELNRRANQLANYLQKRGVGPENRVGICAARSIEMVVGMLGVIKGGGAYVPLDPTYPPERLSFMIKDAEVSVLLTQQRFLSLFPEYKGQKVCLDSDRDRIAQESPANPGDSATPKNLAYIIYTSGSTGYPKGVQIEQRSLVNLITWHQRTFSVSNKDRATHVAGLAFDAAVWELWPYLTAGAGIHLPPNEETRTLSSRLQAWLISQNITICFLPTPLAESLLPLSWPEKPALRLLLAGGDKLHRYPSEDLSFELVNNYGPTENTVVTTSAPIPPTSQNHRLPTIGRPIYNTKVYVLDNYLQPVPVGVPGELYISGHGLARGYLNRPELTAKTFIPNPFSQQPGARLYKTGDLARYLPNGNIEFLGRLDRQLKIRGFRIEPGEIETILTRHSAVQEAVVLARESQPGQKQLLAYIVADQTKPAIVEKLRDYLKQHLPDYMVPAALVIVDAFPLTRNGKINYDALPAPAEIRAEQKVFETPQTPVEKIIAGIWSEVLELEQVGVRDNFFELGGHSLLATQFISRVRDTFQVELSLQSIFDAATIAEFARVIEKKLIENLEQLSEEEAQSMLQRGT